MKSLMQRSLVLGLLLLSACPAIPQQQLANYTTAFNQARTTGEAIILDYAAAKAELERREAAKQSAPVTPAVQTAIPLTYSEPPTGDVVLTATSVRLLALEAITEYNAALAALNAGESVKTVKESTGRLTEVAGKIASASGSAIPGGGALIELAQGLAAELEKARLAAEFKRAIVGGGPIVRRMIAVLQADIPDHYTLRATLAEADFQRVAFEDLSETERRAKQARIKAQIDELEASLDGYYLLLDRSAKALIALETAVNEPVDFTVEANRLLDIALETRQRWVAYQNARGE